MQQNVGIIYSSVDGQTKKICERLYKSFNDKQIETTWFPIENFNADLSKFHTLIIGASVRYGKHNEQVYKFVKENKPYFKNIKTAFFSVNLVARKADKNSPNTNPYFIKFIKNTSWNPDYTEVFAGKLDYSAYSFLDKLMIKFIMKLTKGPTKTNKAIEYTSWQKVDEFALKISKDLIRDKANQAIIN